jgi:hypothetical protein
MGYSDPTSYGAARDGRTASASSDPPTNELANSAAYGVRKHAALEMQVIPRN